MKPENEKQLTAMMMLRETLQAKQSSCTNYDALQVYSSLINLINTELLATERQQLIDAFDYGFSSGYDAGYKQCQENIIEELEMHISINEHDWSRNPQAQLKDYIKQIKPL